MKHMMVQFGDSVRTLKDKRKCSSVNLDLRIGLFDSEGSLSSYRWPEKPEAG